MENYNYSSGFTPSNSKTAEILLQLKEITSMKQDGQEKSQHNFMSLDSEQKSSLDNQPTRCKCRNSKCLKLYCQCFATKALCSRSTGCLCQNCENVEDTTERQEIIRLMEERNPFAFKSKFQPISEVSKRATSHQIGCRCKQSQCLKKYCECFENKAPCGEFCSCQNCGNKENHETQSNDASVAPNPSAFTSFESKGSLLNLMMAATSPGKVLFDSTESSNKAYQPPKSSGSATLLPLSQCTAQIPVSENDRPTSDAPKPRNGLKRPPLFPTDSKKRSRKSEPSDENALPPPQWKQYTPTPLSAAKSLEAMQNSVVSPIYYSNNAFVQEVSWDQWKNFLDYTYSKSAGTVPAAAPTGKMHSASPNSLYIADALSSLSATLPPVVPGQDGIAPSPGVRLMISTPLPMHPPFLHPSSTSNEEQQPQFPFQSQTAEVEVKPSETEPIETGESSPRAREEDRELTNYTGEQEHEEEEELVQVIAESEQVDGGRPQAVTPHGVCVPTKTSPRRQLTPPDLTDEDLSECGSSRHGPPSQTFFAQGDDGKMSGNCKMEPSIENYATLEKQQ